MRIDILTLFPEMFAGPFSVSILRRSQELGHVLVQIWNIRDFATDRHRIVDDTPYGGGPGMLMKPEPICAAVEHVRDEATRAGVRRSRILLMSPQGAVFSQETAVRLAGEEHLILICGHYEGFDDRVRQVVADEEVSIGDYVLTGGELPAMVIADAVIRLLPGVLGALASAREESFADGLLEYPQYTRPYEWRGLKVPDILLSGHHEAIARWRRRQSLAATLARRPDLLVRARLSEEDRRMLDEIRAERNRPNGARAD